MLFKSDNKTRIVTSTDKIYSIILLNCGTERLFCIDWCLFPLLSPLGLCIFLRCSFLVEFSIYDMILGNLGAFADSQRVKNSNFSLARNYSIFDGFTAESGYIESYQTTEHSKIRCTARCAIVPDCRSFFLDISTYACQLHSTILNHTNLMTSSPTSLYFRMASGRVYKLCSEAIDLFFTNLLFLSFNQYVKPFPKQALVFTCLQYKSFENTVGKGIIARNEQFLLFPLCFLTS